MKILANDGISTSGENLLKEAGLEILDNRVSQEHLINFINENNVAVLLVKNATAINNEIIDSCKSLKIILFAKTALSTVNTFIGNVIFRIFQLSERKNNTAEIYPYRH